MPELAHAAPVPAVIYFALPMRPCRYDDTRGALVLTCVIITALSVLFAGNISDLVETIADHHSR